MIESKQMYLDKNTRLMMKASKSDKKAYIVLYNKYFSAITRFIGYAAPCQFLSLF
jgi:hypothetical protein